jgi:dienelactone hydrolase
MHILNLSDIVGSSTAARGIIDIYDAFGFMPQTVQGADRLAESLSALVLVPDFLNGKYAQSAWFAAPPTEGPEKTAYDEFMKNMAVENHVQPLLKVTEAAKEKFAGAKHWGAFGLCWGGKVSRFEIWCFLFVVLLKTNN